MSAYGFQERLEFSQGDRLWSAQETILGNARSLLSTAVIAASDPTQSETVSNHLRDFHEQLEAVVPRAESLIETEQELAELANLARTQWPNLSTNERRSNQ